MKILSLLVPAAGLTLLGASPPPMAGGYGPAGSHGYPACSASVRDRCIQLYERGVATPRNLALNERLGPGRMSHRFARMGRMRGPMMGDGMAPGGSRVVVAGNDYPPCGPVLADRCIQAPAASGYAAPTRIARATRQYERELVRIGERG